MKNIFPYSRQSVDNKDIQEVIKTLKSDIIARGAKISEFERKLSKFVGAKYAVAVNSATAGLHISCLALGVKKGDLVWTVPNTFAATANAALYCGAKIDFVDIEYSTGNIDVNLLEDKLKNSKQKPRVLIPVHFAGQPTEQERILKLSKKYGFKIIEDASHSLGAKRKNNLVGNCKFSQLTVFSFHPVKIITTGEGGMVTTNDKKLFSLLKIFRNHGVSRDLSIMKSKNNSKWYYEQLFLGYNYWTSDINATLGISQLNRVSRFVKKRNLIAKTYNKFLKGLPIELPEVKKNNLSSHHLYIIKLKENLKKHYNKIFKSLIAKKINVNLHYLPVHLHPFYKQKGFKKGNFPISELHASTAISIPIYYNLSKKNQLKIINIIKSILKKHVF